MIDSLLFLFMLMWLIGISLSLGTRNATTDRIEHKLDFLLKHAAIDVQAIADEEVERLIKDGKKTGSRHVLPRIDRS
jgi:hypothetical protein